MAISELNLPTGVLAHSLADSVRLAEALAKTTAEILSFAIKTDGEASYRSKLLTGTRLTSA